MRAKSFSHWRVAPCAPRAGRVCRTSERVAAPTASAPADAHRPGRRAPTPTTRRRFWSQGTHGEKNVAIIRAMSRRPPAPASESGFGTAQRVPRLRISQRSGAPEAPPRQRTRKGRAPPTKYAAPPLAFRAPPEESATLDDLSAALTDGKAFRARQNDARVTAGGTKWPASGNNTFFSPKRPGCGIVTPSHLETFPIRSKFLCPLPARMGWKRFQEAPTRSGPE